MLGFTRQKQIQELLEANHSVKISALSEQFGVSESTIRRDLQDLVDQGVVERVHGGAVRRFGSEPPSVERAKRQSAEKARIAAAAARTVEPESTILLSGGTTTAAMIPHLRSVPGLTIVTNSLEIALHISRQPENDLIVLGGWLRHSERSLLGYLPAQALRDLSPEQAFFSCFGVSGQRGISGASMEEVQTDRAMIAASDRLVVLADRTKFGQRGPVVIAPPEQISTLVTDQAPPPEDRALLDEHGVELLIASEADAEGAATGGAAL